MATAHASAAALPEIRKYARMLLNKLVKDALAADASAQGAAAQRARAWFYAHIDDAPSASAAHGAAAAWRALAHWAGTDRASARPLPLAPQLRYILLTLALLAHTYRPGTEAAAALSQTLAMCAHFETRRGDYFRARLQSLARGEPGAVLLSQSGVAGAAAGKTPLEEAFEAQVVQSEHLLRSLEYLRDQWDGRAESLSVYPTSS
ncbi:hypothetical protein Q5752_002098 [Cryptotrichosporon argae]